MSNVQNDETNVWQTESSFHHSSFGHSSLIRHSDFVIRIS